jgi:two-component system sensor kinase FixL
MKGPEDAALQEELNRLRRSLAEREREIRRLERSNRLLGAILDTATNAIVSIDENQRITLFNNAAQEAFGYSSEEIVGQDLNRLIPSRYGDHQRYIRRFLERRDPEIIGRTIALNALRKSGEEFPIELSLSALEMDGRTTFTAIIKDVSEQRQLEKTLLKSERLAAVGQAVAHVSHELKNPLMIIGGFSTRLRDRLQDENDIRKMDMILDEVRRLERLVACLGDFTREHKLAKRPSDVNAVIRDVIKVMAGAYPADQYRFEQSLCADLCEIHCDPDRLKQVFMNVIANAIEAMPEGGTLAVATQGGPEGIEIRFSDEGRGIPEADLGRIFEPFFTTRSKGSGLGLAISYKIVEAHCGDIRAVNRPRKGATVVIRLPAA